VVALFVPITISAQTPQPGVAADAAPLSEAASRANAKIVMKTEPLLNNTIHVELNGRRIATMEGDQAYAGVFSPGRMRITVPGEIPEASIEFIAEPNKEYLFNIALISSPSIPGFFRFGFIGALVAMGDVAYTIALKETGEIVLSDSMISGTVKDIQTAQQRVVAQPSNYRAWRELAQQHQAAGEPDEAIRAYQEALRLEPNDIDTLEVSGALYAQGGQKIKVREIWESLANLDKPRAEKFFSTYVVP
jgi:tetratricopeptide (TPR) repeat protein